MVAKDGKLYQWYTDTTSDYPSNQVYRVYLSVSSDPTSWPAGGEAAYYFARRTTTSNTLQLEGNTGQTPQQNILANNTVTNSASARSREGM